MEYYLLNKSDARDNAGQIAEHGSLSEIRSQLDSAEIISTRAQLVGQKLCANDTCLDIVELEISGQRFECTIDPASPFDVAAAYRTLNNHPAGA